MATRKGIHIFGTYDIHHKLQAFFIYVVCIRKNLNVGQNRILYCFQTQRPSDTVFYFRIRSNSYQRL